VIELAPGQTGFGASGASSLINPYSFHGGQINEEPTIADGVTCDIVTATTDRDEEFVGSSESNGGDDIGSTSAAGDENWLTIDHAVPDLADSFIAIIIWAQKCTA
jgi:hypothetical protein